MPRKLNRDEPYGIIQNDDQGRAFEQDNTFFDTAGNEWTEPKKRGNKTAVETAPSTQDPTVSPGDDQLNAQLGS